MKNLRYIIYIFMSLWISISARDVVEIVPGSCYVFEPGYLQETSKKTFIELHILDQLARTFETKDVDLFLSKPEKGVTSPTTPKKVIFFNSPNEQALAYLTSLPKEKRVLLVWEPPSVETMIHEKPFHSLFSKVITWDDLLTDRDLYVNFNQPVLKPIIEDVPSYKEKKLCCFVFANKKSMYPGELYSERVAAALFFEMKRGEFDMYGKGWEKSGFSSYKGAVDDKLDCMKNYRFSICYENTKDKHGYITEKIFDSFAAGCVPIYLGAPNITDYVPRECFIDRREFASYDELYAFLKNMSEETYNTYMKNIETFLSSERALAFSMEGVVEGLVEAMLK